MSDFPSVVCSSIRCMDDGIVHSSSSSREDIANDSWHCLLLVMDDPFGRIGDVSIFCYPITKDIGKNDQREWKGVEGGASYSSLVYGIEAVIPIDLVKPAEKLVEIEGIPREDTLEIIEEMHNNDASHNRLYQASMKARHEGQVKERKFQVGELVWKVALHV